MSGKTRRTIIALLLACLAVSLAGVGFAYATEDQANSGSNAGEVERNLTIDQGATGVLVRSNIAQGSVDTHFGLWFNTVHGIVIREEFSRNSEIGENESEANFHLMVAYVGLLEFNNTNGNGAYGPTDTVMQSIDLRNLTYTPPIVTQITSQDGKHGYQIVSNGTWSKPNATYGKLVFGVKADLFGQYAIVNGTVVAPTESKITTYIMNFPFKNTNDKIALQVVATSGYSIEHETSSTESTIKVRSSTAQGFYTWTPTATVNGQTVTVDPSYQSLDHHAIISLSYPSGSTIIHDPILGITFTTTPIIDTYLLVTAAIAAVAVVGVLVYAGRRELARAFSPKVFSPQGA